MTQCDRFSDFSDDLRREKEELKPIFCKECDCSIPAENEFKFDGYCFNCYIDSKAKDIDVVEDFFDEFPDLKEIFDDYLKNKFEEGE